MPEKETIERARKDAQEGKAPTTQAGEFVREEFDHIREGKHGARNTKQAIAIGLSKARRAGVKLPPRPGTADAREEKSTNRKPSAKRSRATTNALKKEGRGAATKKAIGQHSRAVAKKK